MELEEPVHQGILLFPPHGMLGQLKKTWQKKFCQLFEASKHGIQRLEVYDQEEAVSQQQMQRIITLEACVKISPTNQTHVMTVVTKSGVHYFGCFSDSDMTNWIDAFQSVAFKNNSTEISVEEDNDLYCTSGEAMFSVKVVETEASKRCALESKNYMLVVGASEMKLMDGETELYTWPYRFIRRYGYREGKFTFEAGRKCESGEGSFRLEHSSQQEIFKCISARMKSMKQLLSTEKSPSIEYKDSQFHAAMSMEARSRSPLPPSSNTSTNLIDLDFSTISQNSQKNWNSSSTSSLDSISFIKPPPPIVKPKPAKPARKYFPSLLDKKSDNETPDVSTCGKYRKLNTPTSPELLRKNLINDGSGDENHSYDIVEVRSDAWKTHGISTIPHTEAKSDKTDNNEDIQYKTMMLPISSQNSSISKTTSELPSPVSPIIHNVVPNKSNNTNYDKLQHFGSMHRLNKPGYKTPSNVSVSGISSSASLTSAQNSMNSNTSWSNYELVEDMSAVRLADDSHHGYGVIRKKSVTPTPTANTNTSLPKYKVFDDSEYAVVSKPKRV